MRVMTACWGATLVVTFIIKVIVVMTNTDTSHAETVGYIVFGLATGLMIVFTWLYTKVVKRHVTDTTKEGLHNATWGVQSFGNTFSQVVGGGG
jgi:Na+/melibiose symporter-like transporter